MCVFRVVSIIQFLNGLPQNFIGTASLYSDNVVVSRGLEEGMTCQE